MGRRDPYVWHESRPSAMSTFFKAGAAVVIVGMGCVTGLALHGMCLIDAKTNEVFTLAGRALTDLPEFIEGLPPVLADALKDRRDPGYVDRVVVRARVVSSVSRYSGRAIVEVENRGKAVISLLALRTVSLDENGDPICDQIVYGATPLAIEDEFRGPLFPGAKRRIAVRCARSADDVEVEITDLRLWEGQSDSTAQAVALRN